MRKGLAIRAASRSPATRWREPVMDGRSERIPATRHYGLSRRRLVSLISGITLLVLLVPTAMVVSQDEAPQLGGQLNFVGYDGEDARNVAKPFFDETGITMNPTYMADPYQPLTMFQTGGRGQMDIIADNKDFMREVLEADVELFQPLDMSRIPNAAGLFEAFKEAPWVYKDGQMYGVPLIWGDEPVVYDPEKWPEGPPAKYTDFEDPKYAGELVMVDDPVANTWLFARSLGFPEPQRLTQEQLDQTIDAMLKVKPNVVTLTPTLGDQADVLIRGDASMGIGGWAYQIQIAKEKGKTLAAASPAEDGTYYWSDAYAIAVDAPNIDNAYAFIDYMMAPENNAAIAAELGSAATIEAAVPLMPEDARDLYDYEEVRQPGGGILGTQAIMPPPTDEGDIVGIPAWKEAWDRFKLS
jgi:spermidine/putrescine-binding protein